MVHYHRDSPLIPITYQSQTSVYRHNIYYQTLGLCGFGVPDSSGDRGGWAEPKENNYYNKSSSRARSIFSDSLSPSNSRISEVST
jgi:hypothetical protein